MGDSWMKCEGGEDGVCRSPLKVAGRGYSPSNSPPPLQPPLSNNVMFVVMA